uniref:Interferon-related developmental regulator 1 n=1 Tax=Plectus sambesii TaxID=2011161 RepID=A0A914UUU0_9BILA
MGKKRNSNKDKEGGGEAPGKSKNKAVAHPHEDSDADSDAGSEATHLSLDDDLDSVAGDADVDVELTESDELALQERLGGHLDNALHKTTAIREAALKGIEVMLSKYIMPEVVEKWKMTLADAVEKAIKRGGPEAKTAVKIVALISLQLGVDASELVVKLLEPIRSNCADESMSLAYRAECASTLGLCGYLSVDEVEPLLQCLQCVRNVWMTVKSGNSTNESVGLFCAATAAWGLLLEEKAKGNTRIVKDALTTDLPKLCSYLESNQVEIRIAAGETLALLYELGVSVFQDVNFRPSNHQHSLEKLELLATDSLKYRAKRDRRVQRCSFRQVYTAIKERDVPSLTIKFGGETLELDSWSSKLIYDSMCQALRGGMNAHLKRNLILRDIFELGAPINGGVHKMDKLQRMSIQTIVDKARTQQRGKQRDKRTTNFS